MYFRKEYFIRKTLPFSERYDDRVVYLYDIIDHI